MKIAANHARDINLAELMRPFTKTTEIEDEESAGFVDIIQQLADDTAIPETLTLFREFPDIETNDNLCSPPNSIARHIGISLDQPSQVSESDSVIAEEPAINGELCASRAPELVTIYSALLSKTAQSDLAEAPPSPDNSIGNVGIRSNRLSSGNTSTLAATNVSGEYLQTSSPSTSGSAAEAFNTQHSVLSSSRVNTVAMPTEGSQGVEGSLKTIDVNPIRAFISGNGQHTQVIADLPQLGQMVIKVKESDAGVSVNLTAKAEHLPLLNTHADTLQRLIVDSLNSITQAAAAHKTDGVYTQQHGESGGENRSWQHNDSGQPNVELTFSSDQGSNKGYHQGHHLDTSYLSADAHSDTPASSLLHLSSDSLIDFRI